MRLFALVYAARTIQSEIVLVLGVHGMSDQEKKQTTGDVTGPANPGPRAERGAREHKGRRRHNQPNRPLEESVNMDELRDIVELISEHGFTDFELENKDVRVRLRRELAPQIVSMPSNPAPATDVAKNMDVAGAKAANSADATYGVGTRSAVDEGEKPTTGDDVDLHIITSPIVGTFFRAASPNAEPFVGLGSQVNPDTVVCIIEAMKLMNEIQSETSGVVAKIYVENGQPVEYGQPLFGIKN
jgi:acetyl-CoA carboxylase biotin carboxyl carrier protein